MTAAPTTVLIFEDEDLVRMVGSDFLQDGGYRVLEAATGREGEGVMWSPTT